MRTLNGRVHPRFGWLPVMPHGAPYFFVKWALKVKMPSINYVRSSSLLFWKVCATDIYIRRKINCKNPKPFSNMNFFVVFISLAMVSGFPQFSGGSTEAEGNYRDLLEKLSKAAADSRAHFDDLFGAPSRTDPTSSIRNKLFSVLRAQQ